MVKSDLKGNISPGTVACAVIPCCNPTTGKVSFVDDWLSSKAINALRADSQCRPKFNVQGNPKGNLPR